MEEPKRVEATDVTDKPDEATVQAVTDIVQRDLEEAKGGLDFSEPQDRALAVSALEGQVLLIQEAMAKTLQKGVHYGTIPGTQRPSLWQPGAEMLCQMFGFRTFVELIDKTEDWDNGLFAYTYKTQLTSKDGSHITEKITTCSSREKQYKRQIEQYGQDPAELRETLMLMAQKRGYVAAVRAAGACSAIFTQDDDIVPDTTSTPPPVTAQASVSNTRQWNQRSQPAGQTTSDFMFPCQLGHVGEFWKSSKYAPAHAKTPAPWCSIAHWARTFSMDEMKVYAKGLPIQYSNWSDADWQKFVNQWSAATSAADEEPEETTGDLPWAPDQDAGGQDVEEQLNF